MNMTGTIIVLGKSVFSYLFLIFCCILIVLSGLGGAGKVDAADISTLTFVYYYPDAPVLTPFDIFDNMDSLSLIIEKAIEVEVKINKHIFKKREDFEGFKAKNTIDFLIADPVYWMQVQDMDSMRPIVVMEIDGDIYHKRVLYVLNETDATSLPDAKEQKIAMTFPYIPGTKIYQKLFFNNYLNPDTYFSDIQKVDTSASAILSVLYHDAFAALVPEYHQSIQSTEKNQKIKPIFKTGRILNGIFLCNRVRINQTWEQSIKTHMIALKNNEAGKLLLQNLRITNFKSLEENELRKFFQLSMTSQWDNPLELLEPSYLPPDFYYQSENINFPQPQPAISDTIAIPIPYKPTE